MLSSTWTESAVGVLFTFGNALGVKTVERHIESEGNPLRNLTEKCGNRYHARQLMIR